MPTVLVNLDTTQYVQVNSTLGNIVLQANRDTVRVTLSANQPSKSNTVFHIIGGKDPVLPLNSIDTNIWALATSDNSSLIATELAPVSVTDFFFDVQAGNVAGHSAVNAFGHNTDIGGTEEHIWDYGGTYTYSTTADITQIASSNAGDTVAIQIVGLDANHVEQTVEVTLNGTTPVTITAFYRIFAMHNIGAVDLIGNVAIITSGGTYTAGVPNTATTVRGYIVIGDNMSMMALYTIPAGKTGYIVYGKTSASSGKDVTVTFYGRPDGGVFMVRHVVELFSANYEYFFKVPLKVPEKADLDVRAISSSSGTKVSAAFDIILLDN